LADVKPQTPVDNAKSAAELAHWLVLAAIIVTALGLAVQFSAESLSALERLRALHPGETPHWTQQLNTVLRVWIWALPPLLFIDALEQLRKALREYEQGRFFSPASAHAVRGAGERAVYAVFAIMLIAPTLDAWTSGEFRGIVWKFEAIELAMLAFAVAIAAVGRVLDLAVAIKAENDEIV
jgi:hypothetical protein